jgi:hypothetical protein
MPAVVEEFLDLLLWSLQPNIEPVSPSRALVTAHLPSRQLSLGGGDNG